MPRNGSVRPSRAGRGKRPKSLGRDAKPLYFIETQEWIDKLSSLAQRQGKQRSTLIREVLREYVAEQELQS